MHGFNFKNSVFHQPSRFLYCDSVVCVLWTSLLSDEKSMVPDPDPSSCYIKWVWRTVFKCLVFK